MEVLMPLGTLILIVVAIYLAIMAILLPHYVYKIYKEVKTIRKHVCDTSSPKTRGPKLSPGSERAKEFKQEK